MGSRGTKGIINEPSSLAQAAGVWQDPYAKEERPEVPSRFPMGSWILSHPGDFQSVEMLAVHGCKPFSWRLLTAGRWCCSSAPMHICLWRGWFFPNITDALSLPVLESSWNGCHLFHLPLSWSVTCFGVILISRKAGPVTAFRDARWLVFYSLHNNIVCHSFGACYVF